MANDLGHAFDITTTHKGFTVCLYAMLTVGHYVARFDADISSFVVHLIYASSRTAGEVSRMFEHQTSCGIRIMHNN